MSGPTAAVSNSAQLRSRPAASPTALPPARSVARVSEFCAHLLLPWAKPHFARRSSAMKPGHFDSSGLQFPRARRGGSGPLRDRRHDLDVSDRIVEWPVVPRGVPSRVPSRLRCHLFEQQGGFFQPLDIDEKLRPLGRDPVPQQERSDIVRSVVTSKAPECSNCGLLCISQPGARTFACSSLATLLFQHGRVAVGRPARRVAGVCEQSNRASARSACQQCGKCM